MDTVLDGVWRQTIDEVAQHIRSNDLKDFVAVLKPLRQRDRELILDAPNQLAADIVRSRYQGIIEDRLARTSGGKLAHIVIQIKRATQQELFPDYQPASPSITEAAGRHSSLSPKYTFRNFVVGPSNQFAHAACKAVATQPGERYNPLFIYGGVGLGKTHLVHAIGHQFLSRNPDARVLYLSTDSFMNELIAAIRRNRMPEFKTRFRRIELLILDDVQFLSRRERTQEEFFHTFNSLYEGRHQIVLTSDKFPKEIPDVEERLRNRFEWGLIADIQPPDMETRVAILEKKADLEKIELPHDVALFIASKIDSNVRELEGSLTRLEAFASLHKCPITTDFAREALKGILSDGDNHPITIDSIQKAVCEFFHVRPRDLRSKNRTRNFTQPRQVAMYLCRRYTDSSFPVIGDRFGGRDHTTVIHAAQVVDKRIRSDPSFRAAVKQVEQIIEQNHQTQHRENAAF